MKAEAEKFYANDKEKVENLKKSEDFHRVMSRYGLKETDDLYNYQAEAHTIFDRMSTEPLRVDTAFLASKVDELVNKERALMAQVQAEAGHPVDLSSTASYYAFLRNDLKIPPPAVTKTGQPSYTTKLLEPLRPKYPGLAAALEYRQVVRSLAQQRQVWAAVFNSETKQVMDQIRKPG